MERLQDHLLEHDTVERSTLVQNILRKKSLLEGNDSDHEAIRTGLIIMGGGMRGVYGGGAVTGFEKAGLEEVFDVTVGVSAGAADLAYFLSGQAELGTSIYYEDLVSKQFINPARIRKVMDIDYLDHVFRHIKPLDQDHIRNSLSEFHVGVTNAHTGQGEIIDAKADGVDIITAVQASSAIPIAYNQAITINGVDYCDGEIGNGIPLEFALQNGCTDVLIVLNNTLSDSRGKDSKLEKLLAKMYMRKFSSDFRTATLTRSQAYGESLGKIMGNTSVNIGILAPSEMSIGRMSRDSRSMQLVAAQAESQVLQMFT